MIFILNFTPGVPLNYFHKLLVNLLQFVALQLVKKFERAVASLNFSGSAHLHRVVFIPYSCAFALRIYSVVIFVALQFVTGRVHACH